MKNQTNRIRENSISLSKVLRIPGPLVWQVEQMIADHRRIEYSQKLKELA